MPGIGNAIDVNLGATSSANVMVGAQAGNQSISGANNTLVGAQSGNVISSGLNNTFLGAQTGAACTTGQDNVGVGTTSLTHLVGAVQSTAVGKESLAFLTTGGNANTALGYQAGRTYTTESNNISIGAGVMGTIGDSGVTRIGPGSQTACFIEGINGVAVTTPNIVTMDNVTHQLGTASNPTITSTGVLTNTAQPLFLVYPTAVGNVTGDGTTYQVIGDNAVINRGGSYNTGTGVYTTPFTGSYLFTMSAGLTNNAGNACVLQLNIAGSGLNIVNNTVTTTGNYTMTASIMVALNAGDQVYMAVQASGGTKTVGVATGYNTSFSGCKLF